MRFLLAAPFLITADVFRAVGHLIYYGQLEE